MAVIERALVHTRLHTSNASSDLLKMSLGAAMVAERVLAHPDRYPSDARAYYRAERPRFYLNAGRHAEEMGDVRRACRYYLRSWWVGGGFRALALMMFTLLPRRLRSLVRDASHHHPRAAQPSRIR